MTLSVLMPLHRTLVAIIAFALALTALVPMAAPPATRAASTTLTISQIYGGGGNDGSTYRHDFIELYNLTAAPIDLSGLSLQYTSATGSGNFGASSTQLTELSGTIPAGGHFVIQEATGSGGTTELPTPDLVDPTPIAISATGGKVALVTGTTSLGCNGGSTACGADQLARIVDLVGWGSANFFEGAAAPATSNTTAVIRDDEGATDTDNNAADFTTGTPTPRNSGGGGTTDPAGTGAANPSTVETGGSTLLTVTVTPGANPTSTGLMVQADLSSIGGSSMQQFFDDATNGDATLGDNVFSFEYVLPVATPLGAKSLPAFIEDAQERHAETTINLTVIAPTEPTEIHEIQGAGHVSPLAGTTAFKIEGVVTAVSGSSFWMTDPTPDTDPFTSDGLLVFRGSGAKPVVGDLVHVNGPVVEFRPGAAGGFENLTTTEITTPNSFSVVSTGNALPVTVIGEDGRMPPDVIIDDDTAGGDGTIDGPGVVTTYDPASDGIDFYESLEGMYVQVNDALAVGPRTGVGEIAIVGDAGEHAGPFTSRGGLIIGPGAFNPERIHLDDALRPTPMVNVGDGFTTAVTGVIDYSFGNFKLLPTTALVGTDGGLAREAADATGSREVAVATYNVENLTVGNPQAKFDELADQIIHNLQSPDLIAIEEMQDDSGGTNNGVVTAQAGWDKLIATIANRGGPVYRFRSIDPVNNADGGAPGSNIRVGFLYRSDRGLEFVDRPGGDATTDTNVDPTPSGKGAQLTISPGRVLPDPDGPLANAFFATRKSLAGEFRWRGETLFVVANHFSSKGDDHPLFGRFQPPVRFTEFQSGTPEDGWRHAQAQVINDFVDEVLAVHDDAHVIVLGDINDFHFSETVGVLTGELVAGSGGPDADGSGPTLPSGDAPVLGTLFDGLDADEQYSYVFEGNSQVLDQILVSTSLLELDPRYDVVHVNSEFASQASDHDPSVMRVSFQPRRGS
jgi:uncharacterized protein